MEIPTEADWHEWPSGVDRPLDLDEAYAHTTFARKSHEEALELFRTNVLSRAEDLDYMPPVPFRYYMLAFTLHVLSEEAREDDFEGSDAASSFLNLVERKLQAQREFIAPIMPDLLPAVEFVATNQERYDADVHIYGDFREQLERIRKLWGA